MFGNLDLMFKFQEKRDNLKEKLGLCARQKKLKDCIKCSQCCWIRPCELNKEDVMKIASFLNISEQKLFSKYLCVDKFSYDNGKYVTVPIRRSQRDLRGQFVPSARTFDLDEPCIFLNKKTKKCKIYEVRPIGARMAECWGVEPERSQFLWDKKDLVDLGWNGFEERHYYDDDNEEEEEDWYDY